MFALCAPAQKNLGFTSIMLSSKKVQRTLTLWTLIVNGSKILTAYATMLNFTWGPSSPCCPLSPCKSNKAMLGMSSSPGKWAVTSKAYELQTFISKSWLFNSNGWSFSRVSQHCIKVTLHWCVCLKLLACSRLQDSSAMQSCSKNWRKNARELGREKVITRVSHLKSSTRILCSLGLLYFRDISTESLS